VDRLRFRAGAASLSDAHRTVYLPIVRDLLPEVLTVFDFPDPSLIVGERATTTIPAQALYLMNNPFVIRQAEGLADRLLARAEGDAGKLTRAYQLCFSRPPSEKELQAARRFLEGYGGKHGRRPAKRPTISSPLMRTKRPSASRRPTSRR
jgi:hypothetical protein